MKTAFRGRKTAENLKNITLWGGALALALAASLRADIANAVEETQKFSGLRLARADEFDLVPMGH